jgi:hypothetical protein
MERTPMRILTTSAALVALLAAAAPALAATGQCYDASGRPVGAPFDTFNPNRAFIDWVTARGGTCTVSGDPGAYGPRYAAPGYGYPYGYRYRDPGQDPGGNHSDWCSSNPPSGYCAVPETR